MTAKQYLRQVKRLDNIINAKLEQIEKLRAMSINISRVMSPDNIRSQENRSKTEKIIVKIIDLEREVTNDIDRLVDLKREIMQKIDAMEDDNYKVLLTLRYLNFKTWEEIAVEMDYTFQWVHQLHKRALIEFEKKYFSGVDCN